MLRGEVDVELADDAGPVGADAHDADARPRAGEPLHPAVHPSRGASRSGCPGHITGTGKGGTRWRVAPRVVTAP